MSKKNIAITAQQYLKLAEKIIKKEYGNEKFNFLTTSKLKSSIGSFIKNNFWKFNKAIFFDYDLDTQRGALLTGLILILLSRKGSYFIDHKGRKKKINCFYVFFKLVPLFIFEIISIPFLLLKSMVTIRRISIDKRRTDSYMKIRKKIAYFRTDHEFGIKAGGSIGHIKGVSNSFLKSGYSLFFISTDRFDFINEMETPIYILKPKSKNKTIKELIELNYNSNLIKYAEATLLKEKPQLIYQRYSLNNYTGAYLSKKYNVPLVLEYNGSFSWMGRYWGRPLRFEKISDRIELLNFRAASTIVVVSEQLKSELIEKGISKDKIFYYPNGVDPEIYNPDINNLNIKKKYNLENKKVIGFIGTFGKWHGIDVLAKAVKRVTDQLPDKSVHFLFIGDGILLDEVKDIVKKDKVEDFVTFTGVIPQKDAPEYLAACDIFVSPHVKNQDGSQFFGSPTKLFEYMAMGRGIVASKLAQIGDILENNETAIMTEPGNIDELSLAIIKLIKDEKLRKKLGKNARTEVLKKYTWDKNVENLITKLKQDKLVDS